MPRILVIDDDANVAASITMLLKLSGYEITTAHDGAAGIRAAEAGAFDLLIVDIFMPDMDGLETLQVLRQRHPLMPILVMSGLMFRDAKHRTPDFLSMATRLGAAASLHKPFKPQELLDVVQQCLAASSGAAHAAP